VNKPNFREWPTLKLSEVLKPISRKVAVESGREYDLIGVRWYNAGAHIHQTLPGENISTKALTQIREDDIIYNKMWVTKNAFAVAKKEHNGAFGTMEYPQFRALPEKLVPKFIEYLFHNPRFQYDAHRLCKGTTGRARLNPSDFLKLEAGIPSLAEQHKIAEILSTWDKAIAKTEQLIAALQERKKGLMQRLLTGEVRFPGFDGEWEEKSVSQMGQILNGGTPSTSKAEYWNGDIAWTTPTDITSLSTRYIDRTKRNITDEGLKNSSATLIRPNSILVCTRATIGESAINRIPMATNQGFKNLIPNSEFDTEFLYYLLHFHKNQLVRYANGSTFLELSKKDFSRLRFLVPSKKEQEHVSRVLNNCDKEIELHHEKLASLQQQKKGLMQRLLTGQVRVKV